MNTQTLETIAEAIAQKGYIILDDALPRELVEQLASRAMSVPYKQAQIGRGALQHRNSAIRSDHTAWLEGQSPIDKRYLETMEVLRQSMNRALFLGLFDFEAHYARYDEGEFYAKHLDALQGRSNRRLTAVLYLNSDWQSSNGGEMALYLDESAEPIIVEPLMGRLVIFLSEEFWHEVRPSFARRYSIAGWFRVNASNSYTIDTSR
ncbi:MAG: hypothetical protein KU37_08945 [Sulfuricurvum sp. PC08-66]|nr:MAG: hypothetical protein KU37_08945 [Sulfuricurvum sp. PC08-66]